MTQEELEDCHLCGKKVLHLDKHILANHGEKVGFSTNEDQV
jgi:alpha-D-ribose 1-methylphosphonate 5-phosphate C-P lyase